MIEVTMIKNDAIILTLIILAFVLSFSMYPDFVSGALNSSRLRWGEQTASKVKIVFQFIHAGDFFKRSCTILAKRGR